MMLKVHSRVLRNCKHILRKTSQTQNKMLRNKLLMKLTNLKEEPAAFLIQQLNTTAE